MSSTPPLARLLVLEDDPVLSVLLGQSLRAEGYGVMAASNLVEARSLNMSESFDLAILDLILPDGMAFDFANEFRKTQQSPTLFLTVKNDEDSVVRALSEGAADYIRKPFGQKEFLLRIKHLLSVKAQIQASHAPDPVELDASSFSIRSGAQLVGLGKKEFYILSLLMQRMGQLVPRDEIAATLGEANTIDRRTVDSHISHLRLKLAPFSGKLNISSIYGLGYRLEQK